MFTRLGAYLSKCFNAHYTNQDQKIRAAAIKLRAAADEFNLAAQELARISGHTTYVYFYQYSKRDFCSLRNFRLDKIECRVSRPEKVM